MRILVLWRQNAINIRNTILDHAFCFQKYDRENEYFYFNICNGRFLEDYSWIDDTMFDIVIFHYSALSLRCVDKYWNDFVLLMISVWGGYRCKKILMPQDDYTLTERIWDLANGIQADIIYTIIRESDYNVLYPKDKLNNIKIRTVLTGYVEEAYLSDQSLSLRHIDRKYDIVYRARKLPYEFGKHGQLKYELVRIFEKHLRDSDLIYDLDNTNSDKKALLGNSWLDFLASSRTTIGCLGGAGFADITGKYAKKVSEYIMIHREAMYEETKRACFPEVEENLKGMISPRIFESAITRTCQILVGEDYQGILEPNIDYIVLREDFSNIDEVIEKIKDKEYCEQIADNCYEHIIASGKYTYKKFVEWILGDIGKIECVKEPSEALSCYINNMCKKNNDLIMNDIKNNM